MSSAAVNLEQQIRALEEEKKSLQIKNKKLGSELTNMVNSQGNLYRFQEKVERQRTIYAQIAEVGHQFNQNLDFGHILEAIKRFIIDHLNYERCLLLLPAVETNMLSAKMYGGYYDPLATEKVRKLQLRSEGALFEQLRNNKHHLLLNDTKKTPELQEFGKLVQMDEFVAYSLGREANGSLRGLLVMGNTRAHFQHHFRVESDPENDALFSNVTSQIIAAQNTVKFTQAIQLESAQVKRLLNNMRQAVFSIDAKGIVSEPVSLFAQSIFESNLVGHAVIDTLYKDIDRKSEEYSILQTAMNSLFGESELQWDLMEHSLPRRVVYQAGGKEPHEKILKIAYAPIWDEAGVLEKIMYVIEDITELEKLGRQVSEDRNRILLIQEIAGNDILNLNRNFFERAMVLYKRCADLVPHCSKGGEYFGELMRNLHTLKGNARMHGFSSLSKQIHLTEANVLNLKQELLTFARDPALVIADLGNELKVVYESIEKYGQVAMKVFGVKNKFGVVAESASDQDAVFKMVEIHEGNLKILENAIQKAPPDFPGIDEMRMAIIRLRDMPVKPTLSRFKPMVDEISATLNKKVDFRVTGGEAKLNRGTLEELQDSLVHIIRNAIDHGIESPEERVQAGKNEMGILEIQCEQGINKVTISISDDGRGIDSDKIAKIAIERGILTPELVDMMGFEDKLSIIFISGFSSKKVATDLSGRGVGLDMVKKNLDRMGAQFRIESQVGKGSRFVLEVPS